LLVDHSPHAVEGVFGDGTAGRSGQIAAPIDGKFIGVVVILNFDQPVPRVVDVIQLAVEDQVAGLVVIEVGDGAVGVDRGDAVFLVRGVRLGFEAGFAGVVYEIAVGVAERTDGVCL
jgi:hypothetical protein